jgi:glycosyltransferase involved in cell wall biosynthesis
MSGEVPTTTDVGRRRRLPVVFGALLADIHENWPGRNQLMLSMGQERAVVLLERRRRRRIVIPRVEKLGNGVFAIRGAFASSMSRRLGVAQGAAGRVDALLFERALRRAELTPYCFWLETPEPALIRHIHPSVLVYDCMDPCLDPRLTEDHETRERECVRNAMLVFASAGSLERRMRDFGATPVRLPNAALEDDLASSVSYETAREGLGITGRVASYLGTIDSRVDLSLLAAVVKLMPDWQFIFAGRINQDREREAIPLRQQPNVRTLGAVGTATGQRVIAAADVCLVPFVEGPIGDAINPVKMFSYLAFGKPIVATDIEECRDNPFVCTASGAEAFSQAIRSALDAVPHIGERRRFAQANTWGARATFASALLDRAAEKR